MTVSKSNKVLNGMEVRTVVKVRMLGSGSDAGDTLQGKEAQADLLGAADPIEGDSLEDLIRRVEALEARDDRDHDELPHVDDNGNVLGETVCTDPTDSGEYKCTTVDGGGSQLVTKR